MIHVDNGGAAECGIWEGDGVSVERVGISFAASSRDRKHFQGLYQNQNQARRRPWLDIIKQVDGQLAIAVHSNATATNAFEPQLVDALDRSRDHGLVCFVCDPEVNIKHPSNSLLRISEYDNEQVILDFQLKLSIPCESDRVLFMACAQSQKDLERLLREQKYENVSLLA